MSITLHLGVLDVPYAFEPKQEVAKRVRVRVARGDGKDKAPTTSMASPAGMQTTGDVAEILEEQYLVMEYFWVKYGDQIVEEIEKSVANALEAVMVGLPTSPDPFAAAASKAMALFKKFLTGSEMLEILGAGPGTAAGRKGVSHRFKHPYAKGHPPRPPFIDTGLYEASFRVWVEGKWPR